MMYDIKPNPDKKTGGYLLMFNELKESFAVNDIVFPTQKAAQAYLDRLTGLFEDKKDLMSEPPFCAWCGGPCSCEETE